MLGLAFGDLAVTGFGRAAADGDFLKRLRRNPLKENQRAMRKPGDRWLSVGWTMLARRG